MKKSLLTATTAGLCLVAANLLAQNGADKTTVGPYTISSSEEFESPKGHQVSTPISYGKMGIIQMNPSTKDFESFSFQLFSQDLKLQKENTVELEGRIGEKVTHPDFPFGSGMIKLKNKTYLFMREVIKSESGKGEGVSVLEFFPEKLDFAPKSKNLFIAGDKVSFSELGFYDFEFSNDSTKFLCQYTLAPKERNDKLNKEVVGIQVFDENLTKIWGEELEMPYTEAIMDNVSYTLADDGKVYVLAKVFDSDDRKETGKDKKAPMYHYEVLVYQKGSKTPKIIEIKDTENFIREAYIYENPDHTIVIAGFYSNRAKEKAKNYVNVRYYGTPSVDGAYMVRLDVEKGQTVKMNGGYYEIPSEIIKSYISDRDKRKLEKKEDKDENNDIGVDNLVIRKIYCLANGTTKIVAEQHVIVATTHNSGSSTSTTYRTYDDDIFVFSIDKNGKFEYAIKIPKSQTSANITGKGISFNSMMVGNTLHIFFLDNIKNANLSPTEAPARHSEGMGGYLVGIAIDEKGGMKKLNLGEVDKFETNFYIRTFVRGGYNNLISTERKKKMNKLFSLSIKP